VTPGFCPLCASELSDPNGRGYICPNHGRLLLTITSMGPEVNG